MARTPLHVRLLILLSVVLVIGIVSFLVAWHYVLSAEVLEHPSNFQMVSDTESNGGMCGDGHIDAHESCDDGNDVPYDGCTRCLVDGFFACVDEPSICVRQSAGAGCGDNRLEAGEQCDDGNGTDGDGCSYRCEAEGGFLCEGAGPCRKRSPCGNGKIEYGEQCDDGNSGDYDGCNAACQVDHYFACAGEPSVCTKIVLSSSSESIVVESVSSASADRETVVSAPVSAAASSSASLSPRRRHLSAE